MQLPEFLAVVLLRIYKNSIDKPSFSNAKWGLVNYFPSHRPILVFVTMLLWFGDCTPSLAGHPILDEEAAKVIRQVHFAAKRKDFASLEKLMVTEFVWSFGGDGDAKQALEEWRTNPSALGHLYRVTGMKCTVYSKDSIECPRNAGVSYRAGFERMPGGWRMTYFVAGD